MSSRRANQSPVGTSAAAAAEDRATRSHGYREAREEYAAIRELRETNWIAAHVRERRYELEMTQRQVADRAGSLTRSSPSLRVATISPPFLSCNGSLRFSMRNY